MFLSKYTVLEMWKKYTVCEAISESKQINKIIHLENAKDNISCVISAMLLIIYNFFKIFPKCILISGITGTIVDYNADTWMFRCAKDVNKLRDHYEIKYRLFSFSNNGNVFTVFYNKYIMLLLEAK